MTNAKISTESDPGNPADYYMPCEKCGARTEVGVSRDACWRCDTLLQRRGPLPTDPATLPMAPVDLATDWTDDVAHGWHLHQLDIADKSAE